MNSKNEKLKLTNAESTLLEKIQETLIKLINKTKGNNKNKVNIRYIKKQS